MLITSRLRRHLGRGDAAPIQAKGVSRFFLSSRREYFINPHSLRSLHTLASQERRAETTIWTVVSTKMAVAQMKNGVLGFTCGSGGVSQELLGRQGAPEPAVRAWLDTLRLRGSQAL